MKGKIVKRFLAIILSISLLVQIGIPVVYADGGAEGGNTHIYNIGEGKIIIDQGTTEGTLKVTHGSNIVEDNIPEGTMLILTGTSGTENKNAIKIQGGVTANIIFVDLSVKWLEPVYILEGSTVHLTLIGNNTLTNTNAGTASKDGAGLGVGEGNTLTITDASTGTLTAIGTGYGAGIGGGNKVAGGSVIIAGGSIIATGIRGAGIGGGSQAGSGGSVTITGGSVIAKGEKGAGIGGGFESSGGTVIITGGSVIATGNTGAGIGGGSQASGGGTVIISGGSVAAIGTGYGAGIGGGYISSGGTVEITGGNVIATGNYGAGIGGGGNTGSGGNVTIAGGSVTATGSYGAGIGGGSGGSDGSFVSDGNAFIVASSIGNKAYVEDAQTKGIIFDGKDGVVYGNPVIAWDAKISTDKTLTVTAEKSMTVNTGVTLTNSGSLINNGRLINNGTLIIDGGVIEGNYLEGDGTFRIALTEDRITVALPSEKYTGEIIKPNITIAESETILNKNFVVDIGSYRKSFERQSEESWSPVEEIKNAGKYRVAYEKDGNIVSKEFIIGKASAPEISFPTSAVSITYGQKLSESSLTGGSTEFGSFAWVDPIIVPTVENSGYDVVFTANNDTLKNYEKITNTNQNIKISVSKIYLNSIILDAKLDNDLEDPKVVITASVNSELDMEMPTGSFSFVISKNSSNIDITGATDINGEDGKWEYTWTGFLVGDYKIKAIFNGDSNYNITTSDELDMNIPNNDQAAPTETLQGQAPTTIADNDGKITGTTIEMEYKLISEDNWTQATAGETRGLAAGTYQVRYAAKVGFNPGLVVEVIVPAYVNSTDATLSNLKVAGQTVTDFAADKLTYNVELSAGTTEVPVVLAIVTDGKANAVVTDATELPGSTTVEVTAEDGITKKTYTINFTVKETDKAVITFIKLPIDLEIVVKQDDAVIEAVEDAYILKAGNYTYTAIKEGYATLTNVEFIVSEAEAESKIKTVEVTMLDSKAPEITLLGDATVNLANGADYTDAGARAEDNKDGTITESIIVTISNDIDDNTTFDNTKAATYTYHYNVSDAAGNKATEVIRTVIVAENSLLAEKAAALLRGKTVNVDFEKGEDRVAVLASIKTLASDNIIIGALEVGALSEISDGKVTVTIADGVTAQVNITVTADPAIALANQAITSAIANVVDVELAYGTEINGANIIEKLPLVEGIEYIVVAKEGATWTVTVKDTEDKGSPQNKEIQVTLGENPLLAENVTSVSRVKTLVVGATYTIAQAEATDEATLKTTIESIISGLALDGVGIKVTKVLYTQAIEGTEEATTGANGTYTFTVALSKGSDATLVEVTTETLTMTITATAYVAPVETYTVTFNSNNGSLVDPISNVEKNATIILPTAPIKEGFKFEGWFTESGLTNEFTTSTQVTSNIIVYAKWEVVVLPVEVNKTALTNAIAAVKYISVSTDGSDIEKTQEWTTEEIKVTLEEAVAAAQVVADKEDATQEEVNGAVTSLASAVEVYNQSKAFGTKEVVVDPVVKIYTVIFKDHDGLVIKTQKVEEGKSAVAPSNPERSGYTFTGWDGSFSNIIADTTVTANYSKDSSGYNTSGGSSDSGGSSGGSSVDTSKDKEPTKDKDTTKVETKKESNAPTKVIASTSSKVTKGTANVEIDKSTVKDAIEKAQAAAKKNGTEEDGISVEIKVDTKNIKASNLLANIGKSTLEDLVKAGVKELSINSDIGIISLDPETLKTIQEQVGVDVNISMKKVDKATLSQETKGFVGDRPVFDFTITGSNGKKVTEFGKGKISISLPYNLGENENPENLVVYYIDSNGKVKEMLNSVYNKEDGTLLFDTDHFSKFAIGYKEDSDTITFTDIENHWAKDSIEFVTARGLFTGTGQDKFSPDMPMTRGMFVTVVGRLASAEVSSYKASSFTDVKTNAYYMGYIEWASKNKIVEGIKQDKFSPDMLITREQIGVILYRYSNYKNYDTTQGGMAIREFTDYESISDYALQSMAWTVNTGLLQGSDNKLMPKDNATRAEVAAILMRFSQTIE